MPARPFVALALVLLVRWIGRRSATLATLVGLGVLGRLLLTSALFWTSYLDVRALAALHSGDGFWQLAPDARSYFLRAADALEHGAGTIARGSASPAYVRLLMAWMHLIGPHVPGVVLLNVVAYVAICVLVVAVLDSRHGAREARACRVSVAAFTLSPASVVFGAQVLKDQTFAFFVVLSCVGVLVLLGDRQTPWPRWLTAGVTIGAVGLSSYMLAGMRPYFVFFEVFALLLGLFVRTWSAGRVALSPPRLGEAITLLVVTWLCFAAGAGPYYDQYERLVLGERAGQPPARVAVAASSELDAARKGFVETGGATNVGTWASSRDDSAKTTGAVSPLGRLAEKARTVSRGLMVMFVPISLLKLAGLVQFGGGRGLLIVTDIDTLFMVGTFGWVAFVMWRHWRPGRPNVAYVAFALGFSALLTLLLAYVTNFGTLFRLRLMVATLVWATPLGLVRSTGPRQEGVGAWRSSALAEPPASSREIVA